MEIDIITVEARKALAIRGNVTSTGLSKFYNDAYKEINTIMKSQNLGYSEPAPFGIYYKFTPEDVEVEAGVCVTGEPKAESNARVMQTYSGKALRGKFFGHYDGLKEAWKEFDAYAVKNNYVSTKPCFEVYITIPDLEPDSSKWLTEIYLPLD